MNKTLKHYFVCEQFWLGHVSSGGCLTNQGTNSHDPMLLGDTIKLHLLFSLFWLRDLEQQKSVAHIGPRRLDMVTMNMAQYMWLKSASALSGWTFGFSARLSHCLQLTCNLLYIFKFRCTSDSPQIVELKTQRNGSICVNILTFSDQSIWKG